MEPFKILLEFKSRRGWLKCYVCNDRECEFTFDAVGYAPTSDVPQTAMGLDASGLVEAHYGHGALRGVIRRCRAANDWSMMNYVVSDHATGRRLGSGSIVVRRMLDVISDDETT